MNVDQLAWKKISLENDEFDDFEEIEGVDVEYVDKDGNKVFQFKVINSLGHLILRLSNRRKSQNSERQSSLRRRKFQMTSGRELPTLRRILTHKTPWMEINSRILSSCNQTSTFQVGQKYLYQRLPYKLFNLSGLPLQQLFNLLQSLVSFKVMI